MSQGTYLAIAVIALTISLTGASILISRSGGIKQLTLPPAKPGRWYGGYHAAWTAAHPGAWERGEAQSGGFFAGDVWGSSTLDWDREWFERNGMSLPRKHKYVSGKAAPNSIRIGTLGPGESVQFPIHWQKGQP